MNINRPIIEDLRYHLLLWVSVTPPWFDRLSEVFTDGIDYIAGRADCRRQNPVPHGTPVLVGNRQQGIQCR